RRAGLANTSGGRSARHSINKWFGHPGSFDFRECGRSAGAARPERNLSNRFQQRSDSESAVSKQRLRVVATNLRGQLSAYWPEDAGYICLQSLVADFLRWL